MGLFDDLVESPAAPTAQPATTQPTEETKVETATTEATKTEDQKTVEPVRETITVDSIDSLPQGYVDVRGFAWELTMQNLRNAQEQNRTPGPDDMVDTQAVYAATRGKRWSLPALEAVTADGTKLGVVIPLQAGLSAWNERPERGTGTGAVGMTPERRQTRILRAGKAKALLAKLEKRVKRYGELLSEVDATWDDADEAYNKWLETEDGKKEIADNDKNGDE